MLDLFMTARSRVKTLEGFDPSGEGSRMASVAVQQQSQRYTG